MKQSLRDLIFERDHHACYHCGTTEGLSIQHRANRGARNLSPRAIAFLKVLDSSFRQPVAGG